MEYEQKKELIAWIIFIIQFSLFIVLIFGLGVTFDDSKITEEYVRNFPVSNLLLIIFLLIIEIVYSWRHFKRYMYIK